MKIGVFDSGIGGLTILKELLSLRPNNQYIYYGDNINLPYGEKSKEELIKIGDNIINYFINQNVNLIILACGTMSSVIDKSKYKVKIIDIIEPTVEYLKGINTKSVLLLGTTRAIEEGIFKRKLEENNILVYDKACPKFVLILENKIKENIDIVIDEYLKEFKYKSFQHIILGCTHFSLIDNKISEYLNVETVNIGKLIANILPNDGKRGLEIYFGKVDNELENNVRSIINYDIIKTNLVERRYFEQTRI